MRIIIVDTYYPEVIADFYRQYPHMKERGYGVRLGSLLDMKFGTSDFWSNGLRACGHEVYDLIESEHHDPIGYVKEGKADAIIFQDLSVWPLDILRDLSSKSIFAAQCSCEWPGDDRIRMFDVVFTSFPHYVERIHNLGVNVILLPLAFDPGCLIYSSEGRIYDVTFVGGFGRHWPEAVDFYTEVAFAVPGFKWWGYGVEFVGELLKSRYQGRAWGVDMYRIYSKSKIVLNRHSKSVAKGYANNMRMFEATGMGALLMTEAAPNLKQLFIPFKEVGIYTSYADAIHNIGVFLNTDGARISIAAHGQAKTLTLHTYENRMKVVSEVLSKIYSMFMENGKRKMVTSTGTDQ